MRYDIFGPYEVERNRHGRVVLERRKSEGNYFWDFVQSQEDGLPDACGSYVYALRHGEKLTPWYVGKAERLTFKSECSSPHKQLIFNEVLDEISHSAPNIFFVARITDGGKFCKPTEARYADVEFLENMIIGLALEQNPRLFNIRATALLKEMVVPGLINTPARAPTLVEQKFKSMLKI